MSLSLPEGFTMREAAEEEAPAVAQLINAFDATFDTGERVTEQDVRVWRSDFGDRGGAWFVVEHDRPAAYLEVFPRGEEASFDGYVHPDFFGRGLGAAIARFGEERARELSAPSVVSGALDADRRATELFTRSGWRHERVFLRMAIDLDGTERFPDPPEGFVLRTFRPDDAEAFHAAGQEAFADHWNFHPEPFEEFRRRTIGGEDFDPTLWWVAEAGGELAAVIRCTAKRFEMGWVNMLAVRPAWRRRGLGEVLLRTAFAEFARRGERRVGLGVDAENTTGATKLYERVGMQSVFQANVFRKMLV